MLKNLNNILGIMGTRTDLSAGEIYRLEKTFLVCTQSGLKRRYREED